LQRKLHGKQTLNESYLVTLEDDEEEVKASEYQHDIADASQTKQTGGVLC